MDEAEPVGVDGARKNRSTIGSVSRGDAMHPATAGAQFSAVRVQVIDRGHDLTPLVGSVWRSFFNLVNTASAQCPGSAQQTPLAVHPPAKSAVSLRCSLDAKRGALLSGEDVLIALLLRPGGGAEEI